MILYLSKFISRNSRARSVYLTANLKKNAIENIFFERFMISSAIRIFLFFRSVFIRIRMSRFHIALCNKTYVYQ